MDFKVLFALVAVFVVIMSASAVCAIDDVAGDDATSGDNETVVSEVIEEPDDVVDFPEFQQPVPLDFDNLIVQFKIDNRILTSINLSEEGLTGDDVAADDDAEGETEGGDDAPLVISPQDEDNSTTNGTTSETTLDSNTAGNPIFILLAALAVLGIVPLRRNK